VSDFDDAWSAAEAELGGASEGSGTPTTDTSPEPVSAPTTEPTTSPSTPVEPPAEGERPWWEDRLDDTVDVNGQAMTLRELREGGLRQSDYTRKTQELAAIRKQAEWAENFQGRLRQDPVGTLRAMAEELRLIPAGEEDFTEVTPEAQELYGVRQDLEQLKVARLAEEIRREVVDLRARHSDFNSEEILPMLHELGEQGVVLTVEQGYYLWKGQQATRAAAAQAAAELKAKAIADAEAAKRAAQVAPGHSPAASDDDEARFRGMSFDEIAEEVFAGIQ